MKRAFLQLFVRQRPSTKADLYQNLRRRYRVNHQIEPLPYIELEKKIGYVFRNKEFLLTALTHSSFVNETKQKTSLRSNERLEFLGDSILSVIVSEHIYRSSPELDEGYLTRIR
ncbi:MAG: hypothetical protein IKV01_02150, partial [Clostridia bacterium]|nr:hypothetical protein [Clostridia bacterium]